MATRNLPNAEIYLNPSNFSVALSFQNVLSLCYLGYLNKTDKQRIRNFELTEEQLKDFPLLFKELYSPEYLNSYNTFLNDVSEAIGKKPVNNSLSLTPDQIVLLNKYSKIYEINIDPIASKTIYAIHFEKTPNSYNQFKEGINTVYACPFYVEMNRIDQYNSREIFQKLELKNLYFHLNMYFECHASFYMNEEGDFIRI